MLPLESSGLSTESQWHQLKDVLLACKYFPVERARSAFYELPDELQHHWLGVGLATYLNDGRIGILDGIAVALAHRGPEEAWTLIEKL